MLQPYVYLMEWQQLGLAMLGEVNVIPDERGLLLPEETIVGATLICAPSWRRMKRASATLREVGRKRAIGGTSPAVSTRNWASCMPS